MLCLNRSTFLNYVSTCFYHSNLKTISWYKFLYSFVSCQVVAGQHKPILYRRLFKVWKFFEHPSYSCDLLPRDYLLFLHLNNVLRYRKRLPLKNYLRSRDYFFNNNGIKLVLVTGVNLPWQRYIKFCTVVVDKIITDV